MFLSGLLCNNALESKNCGGIARTLFPKGPQRWHKCPFVQVTCALTLQLAPQLSIVPEHRWGPFIFSVIELFSSTEILSFRILAPA